MSLPLNQMRPAPSVSRILFRHPGCPGYRRRSFICGCRLPGISCDLPGSIRRAVLKRSPIRSCTGWGLPSFPGRPGNWCALTAPFHPYPAPTFIIRTVSGLPEPDNKSGCRAVCFLLHLPSRCRDSTLWSTLPFGVRTFLRPHEASRR